MSLLGYSTVWSMRLKGADLVIMLAIADHSNGSLECSPGPSFERLAAMTGLDPRSVKRVVKRLEIDEYLFVTRGGRPGRGRSNCYKINVIKGDSESPFMTYKPKIKGDSRSIKGDSESPEARAINYNQKNLREGRRPAGVIAYEKIVKVEPAYSWWAKIDKVVGDEVDNIKLWSAVVKGWLAKDWRADNIKGMLERYERRDVPGKEKKNGQKQQGKIDQYEPGSIEKRVDLKAGRTYWFDTTNGVEVDRPL